MKESRVNMGEPFPTNAQAAELVEPGKRALHHPCEIQGTHTSIPGRVASRLLHSRVGGLRFGNSRFLAPIPSEL
jgi:hypothetical protein